LAKRGTKGHLEDWKHNTWDVPFAQSRTEGKINKRK